MGLDKTDKWWILGTAISAIGLIVAIIALDFSKISPVIHIKLIYVILIVSIYLLALYIILIPRNERKKVKKKK